MRHETKNYHKIAKEPENGIIDKFEYPRSTVPAQCNSTLDSRIKKYTKILNILGRVMRLLGGENLALRGHHESTADQEISDNTGNFIIQNKMCI